MTKQTSLTVLITCCLTIWLTHFSVAQELSQPRIASPSDIPLSSPTASNYDTWQPNRMSIVQERARFEADQRMLRMEFNKWIGYSPARPNLNASYMSIGSPYYYLPSRGYITSAGFSRLWYW